MMKKPEAAIALIHNALEAGIEASCILMDTWFTNEPFIHAVLNEGLDVIGMVKDNKQQYKCGGKLLGLKELVRYMRIDPAHNILGSVVVYTKKYNIAVKLVNIAYCAMKLLPYQDEIFSEYRTVSVQKFRFALSSQIRKQVFYITFVNTAQNSIKSNAFIDVLKQLVGQQGVHL